MNPNDSVFYPTAEIWHTEAEQAARQHVFAARMPAAALLMGKCSLTATEAVHGLGAHVADYHRDGFSWRWIANLIEVPPLVAIAWAVESRIHRIR